MIDDIAISSYHQNADIVTPYRSLHIEPTTRCKIACVTCPRTRFPELVPIVDIDIDIVVRSAAGYDDVYMCGDHGDSIYHPRLHEMLDRLQEAHPTLSIKFETNGSGRTPTWWKETAQRLKSKDTVIFNIDGVRDNNHIYRIGSKWDTIEQGARSLRAANPDVIMIWRYIAMHHNQDSLAEAYTLSKEIGFNHFMLIWSDLYDKFEWTRLTKSLRELQDMIDHA